MRLRLEIDRCEGKKNSLEIGETCVTTPSQFNSQFQFFLYSITKLTTHISYARDPTLHLGHTYCLFWEIIDSPIDLRVEGKQTFELRN